MFGGRSALQAHEKHIAAQLGTSASCCIIFEQDRTRNDQERLVWNCGSELENRTFLSVSGKKWSWLCAGLEFLRTVCFYSFPKHIGYNTKYSNDLTWSNMPQAPFSHLTAQIFLSYPPLMRFLPFAAGFGPQHVAVHLPSVRERIQLPVRPAAARA